MWKQLIGKGLLIAVVILGLFVLPGVLSAQGNRQRAFERVREVQRKHTDRLMDMDDVEGTAIGHDQNGQWVVKVLTARPGVPGIAETIDGMPVQVVVTGKIVAFSNPAGRFARPVPIGVSTGHPEITAGTIGCRVKDDSGNLYALSNNHVFANQNDAALGDNVLQPGPLDGGTSGDEIGTLFAFEPIVFSDTANNRIDAAIARIILDGGIPQVGTGTPIDGYGIPNASTVEASIGQVVQKFGRTTGLTQGQVSGTNTTVLIYYGARRARFINQILIASVDSDPFSLGGDSGSLIVTDAGKNPVGLLFAGNDIVTIANPIDLVLGHFEVTIDDEGAGPPPILESISVAPISKTIDEGQAQQFTATGSFDDSSTADLTSTVTWSSSDGAVATINASGLATGILAGTTVVTAAQDGTTSNPASLEVTAPPSLPILESISVIPVSLSLEEGQTQQFTALGTYVGGGMADLTSTATWVSSNAAIASIDASGLATGILAGTTAVTAAQDGTTSNTASLEVTSEPSLPVLASISVIPVSSSIEVEQTQQFTALGSYDDSSTADLTSTVTWSSSNVAIASIDASGLATGILAGTTNITATKDGITSGPTAVLTVTPASTTDTATITKAEYKRKSSELNVEATSSEGETAVLTLKGYGQMTYNARKQKYVFKKKSVDDPQGLVTVTSASGATDTATVKSR